MNNTIIILLATTVAGLVQADAAKAEAVTFLYGTNTKLQDPTNGTIQSWNIVEPYSAHLSDSGTVWYTTDGGFNFQANCSPSAPWDAIYEKDWSGKTIDTITADELGGGTGHHAINLTTKGTILAIILEEYKGTCGDRIVEYDPEAKKILWSWHTNDHLGSGTKKLIAGSTSFDPFHVNNADLDPATDRIVISAHEIFEVFIVDHSIDSTTAKTSKGDLLWRFGNPGNYGASGTQIIDYAVHSARFVDKGVQGEGNVILYANLSPSNGGFSTGYEVKPLYSLRSNGEWDYEILFKGTNSNDNINNMGGMDKLFNGNWLVTYSNEDFTAYEFDTANGTDQTTSQAVGSWKSGSSNGIRRYPVCTGPLLAGRKKNDAEAISVLNQYCGTTPIQATQTGTPMQLTVANNAIHLNGLQAQSKIIVVNLQGKTMFQARANSEALSIDAQGWPRGAYVVSVQKGSQTVVSNISILAGKL